MDIASVGTIENGGITPWNTMSRYFKDLPSYLVGVNLFQFSHSFRVEKDPSFEIIIHRPSTVFFAWYSSNDGGFSSRLQDDGWNKFDGQIATSWVTLSSMLMKTFTKNGLNKVTFGSMSEHLYGVIFVRGKKSKINK